MRAVTDLIDVVATGLRRLGALSSSAAAATKSTVGGAHKPVFVHITASWSRCIPFAFCVGVAEEAIVAVEAGVGNGNDGTGRIKGYSIENVRGYRYSSLRRARADDTTASIVTCHAASFELQPVHAGRFGQYAGSSRGRG